ncbi:MAG: class I SAM-dependent methyltransferase [Verrucomicrobia subdivision 3 bacterium]|nr:class I SAM-dependent methyltransferase [Limisphaerales bacterium]
MKQSFTCRACGCSRGELILDLGIQPLANNLPEPEQLANAEPKFPLQLFVCPECWLTQITHTVPPVSLFSEYVYFSSFSETMLAHARAAVERYRRDFGLGKTSRVAEIASNDGYLLRNFAGAGIPCYGIEPAANVARAAQEKGIETVIDFFGKKLAERLADTGKQADLILGNNVFAHAPDINDFVAGLKTLLSPGGRIVLEFPYIVDLITRNEFDTIYHEHVFYFALTPLIALFRRHGLEIVNVEQLPIHGGSLRIVASHAGKGTASDAVRELLNAEKKMGLDGMEFYEAFTTRVRETKRQLVDLLARLRDEGKRIAAYGAAAKGSTLLNYCGLGRDLIEFVADRSPHKKGRYMPGAHVPIVPADELVKRMPDYALLLSWNFATEILRQQAEYTRRGGKFIIPIPTPEVLQ